MSKKVSMAEVAKHKTDKDCWVVIKGNAYDVTKFLPDHRRLIVPQKSRENQLTRRPTAGGKKAILMYAGKDATAEFEMLHKPDIIVKYGKDMKIGPVE
jgi:cytochrome b involved in lipid metabolism